MSAMDNQLPVFIISGGIGAGKTTISERLMGRFPRGVHIPVDSFRSFVVSGYADPTEPWSDETDLQFRLAREAAADMAARYAVASFAVAIDDILAPDETERCFVSRLPGARVHRVFLQPSLETALSRNAIRTNKSFDTSVLTETLRLVHGRISAFPYAEKGWQVIDTSDLTVEETVDLILAGAQ
jgi:predicted ATPase